MPDTLSTLIDNLKQAPWATRPLEDFNITARFEELGETESYVRVDPFKIVGCFDDRLVGKSVVQILRDMNSANPPREYGRFLDHLRTHLDLYIYDDKDLEDLADSPNFELKLRQWGDFYIASGSGMTPAITAQVAKHLGRLSEVKAMTVTKVDIDEEALGAWRKLESRVPPNTRPTFRSGRFFEVEWTQPWMGLPWTSRSRRSWIVSLCDEQIMKETE